MSSYQTNISVRFISERKGRGLFAERAFAAKDVIFEEAPLICAQFLWNEFYHYVACEYCMKSLEDPQDMARRLSANLSLVLPHAECGTVQKNQYVHCPRCQLPYCSSECQDKALDQYHSVLCVGQHPPDPDHPMVVLQEAWKSMHYPPETASIMLIAKMIATVKQATNKQDIIAKFQQFCHAPRKEERELSHKLLGEQFEGQFETLQSLLLNALYDDSVAEWFTPNGLRSLFALIGMNGQGVGSSSLSVYVHNCDDLDLEVDERENLDQSINHLYADMEKESGSFLNCEGSALYQLQSRCNHSCTPNAEIRFLHNNSTLSLVAVTDIAEDEEILVSYLDECSRERSRHSRQRFLRENYLFTCECQKCVDQCDEPDVTSSSSEDEGSEEDGQEKEETTIPEESTQSNIEFEDCAT